MGLIPAIPILAFIGALTVLKIVVVRKLWSSKALRKMLSQGRQKLDQLVANGGVILENGRDFIDSYSALLDAEDLSLSETVQRVRVVHNACDQLPEKLRDLAESQLSITPSLEDILKQAAVLEGWRLLEQKLTRKSKKKLRAHMQDYYRGLYLIGLGGEPLTGKDRDSFASDLLQFHNHLGRPEDAALIDWYQTVGTSKRMKLSQLLHACPEATELEIDLRYIAFAMGEEVELPKEDLLDILEANVPAEAA